MASNELVAGALKGDVKALEPLGRQPWAAVELAARSVESLVLRPDAIVRVLAGLREGLITADQAQAWASFVRRGYFAGGNGPIHPLGIDYDQQNEDAMVEAIARLDE